MTPQQKAQRALDHHRSQRPSNHDYAALCVWAREDERLELLVALARPLQGKPHLVCLNRQASAYHHGTPEERLARMMAKLNATMEAIGSERDSRVWSKLKNRIHDLRYQMRTLGNETGIEIPEFPPVPAG